MLNFGGVVGGFSATHLKKYATVKLDHGFPPRFGVRMKNEIWNHQPENKSKGKILPIMSEFPALSEKSTPRKLTYPLKIDAWHTHVSFRNGPF